jgi:hypothetical protein
MLRFALCVISLAFVSGCGAEPQSAAPLSRTTLRDVQCSVVACVPRQNPQRTVTTLAIAGTFNAHRGRAMILRVDDALSRRTVIRESGQTLDDGRYAANIAADRLQPGRYKFLVVPEESRGLVVAAGRFTIARGILAQAPPRQAAPIARAVGNAAAVRPAPASPIQAMRALIGTWRGTNGVAGNLDMRADGSYVYNGLSRGHYKFYGGELVFDGALAAWNGGHATVRGDYLDFYWTSLDGAHQWYSFAKST